jgi:D-3-phosphoglycerate dehydrogenase
MSRLRILCMHDTTPYPEVLDPLRPIADVVVEEPDQKRLADTIGGYDAYICSLKVRVNAEVLSNAHRLKVVSTSSTGTDHIDLDLCAQRGIEVLTNKHDIDLLKDITATAELGFGLLLGVVRHIPWAFDAAKQGFWARDVFRGRQLNGKTYGILGVGRLGTISAQYAHAFRMRVIGCDIRKIEMPYVRQVDFDTLIAESDVLSIHVHLTDETRGMIGRREFARMKDGIVIINTARGAIMDEAALLDALDSGKVAGAGLDVIHGEWDANLYHHPLIHYARTHDNLLIVPHLGGVTLESQAITMRHTCEKLARWFRDHGLC